MWNVIIALSGFGRSQAFCPPSCLCLEWKQRRLLLVAMAVGDEGHFALRSSVTLLAAPREVFRSPERQWGFKQKRAGETTWPLQGRGRGRGRVISFLLLQQYVNLSPWTAGILSNLFTAHNPFHPPQTAPGSQQTQAPPRLVPLPSNSLHLFCLLFNPSYSAGLTKFVEDLSCARGQESQDA